VIKQVQGVSMRRAADRWTHYDINGHLPKDLIIAGNSIGVH
jgi:hypothetical protein